MSVPPFACKSVVTGMRYSMAIAAVDFPERNLQENDILAWGDLPDGTTWPPGEKWKMIASGDSTVCGITLDGVMHCWGAWVLGADTMDNPVQNATFANWAHVSVGGLNHCAVQNGTGYAICWGDSANGINDIPSVGEGWKSISAGNQHACGITLSGIMHCWGAAQVTGYFPAKSGLPDEVNKAADGGWTSVAAGYAHTCGMSRSGQEYCWGKYGNFRTQASIPGWRVMTSGSIYNCVVNSTYHGSCSKTNGAPGPNAICEVMCREDVPQLMVNINGYVIKPTFEGGMADVCRNQCCLPPPKAYSVFDRAGWL